MCPRTAFKISFWTGTFWLWFISKWNLTQKKIKGRGPSQVSTKHLLPEKCICWLVMWFHDQGVGFLLPVQNVQWLACGLPCNNISGMKQLCTRLTCLEHFEPAVRKLHQDHDITWPSQQINFSGSRGFVPGCLGPRPSFFIVLPLNFDFEFLIYCRFKTFEPTVKYYPITAQILNRTFHYISRMPGTIHLLTQISSKSVWYKESTAWKRTLIKTEEWAA